jgi:pimeloyl-ACP methyl ester carboxylesterase
MGVILIVFLFLELITMALLWAAIYFFVEWLHWKDGLDPEYAKNCLYAAAGLSAYVLFAGIPIKWMVSNLRRKDQQPLDERSQETDRLSLEDGTVINIEFFGKKDAMPILFVHGWNANSTEWFYQKRYFSSQYRVILIDLPGLGRSKGPRNNDYSLPKMAGDLDAVIRHLQLDRLVLWGHSIGGMVILTYCAKFKAGTKKALNGIILQHTTYTDPVRTSILSKLLTLIKKPVLYPVCYLMIVLWPLFWLSKWFSYLNGNLLLSTRFLTFTGTQSPAQLSFISRLSAMAPPQVFARGMLGMMRTYDVTNDLDKITVPALVIAADHDRLTRPEASTFLHGRLQSSMLETISPAGHQGLVERHEESNRAAEQFIKGLDS